MKKQPKIILRMKRGKFPTHALIYADWPARIVHSELGHGSTAQRRHCKKYAESRGYFVKKGFGYNNTWSIVNAIERFPERKFAVIVDSMARLGRTQEEIDSFCEVVKQLGATVESPNYDLTIPAKDQFKKKISDAVAKYDHDIRSAKAKAAVERRKENNLK